MIFYISINQYFITFYYLVDDIALDKKEEEYHITIVLL